MKSLIRLFHVMLVIFSISIMASCSNGKGAVETIAPASDNPDTIAMSVDEGRSMIAMYEMTIDPEAFTVDLQPLQRDTSAHFNLTGFYPGVLSIVGYGFDPAYNNSFYADMRLSHPYPGSGIDAFDPRLIAIIPANTGVSYYFPLFNVVANKSAVRNPDGFTPLWDSVMPSIPGTNNPYLSYFKNEPNRIWSSNGTTSETRRMYLNFAGFGGPLTYKLVVDVNTPFPTPPVPGIHNAPEPVDCSVVISEGLTPDGGSATIDVTFLDWQGYPEIKCKVECPDLFDGAPQLFYSSAGPNPNEYVFSGTISNDKLALRGEYDLLIAAWDIPTNVHVNWVVKVNVALEAGAWIPDPARLNVNLTALDDMFPARPGSDLGVIDNDDPDIGGVVMYEPDDMVVKLDLNLTESNLHGYSYEPMDADPSNPHPDFENHPTSRIDAQSNGIVVQSWDDPHLGVGPDLADQFQREDSLIGIMQPDGTGWIDFLISAFPDMSNDNLTTPWWDESQERPKLTDVYEEANADFEKYVVSGLWSGTTIWDDEHLTYPYAPIGVMGGIEDPYFDEDLWVITMNWGLWVYSGPPSNEIVAGDASQDPIFTFQYWGYSGDNTGPSVVGIYDKWGSTVDAFYANAAEANLLDLELIPRQNPPLDINGILQDIDWIVILLDNQTIEIFDPFTPGGNLVTTIDLGMLEGDVKYLDIRNSNCDIYVSHTDGITQYCSVFVLGE